MSKDKDSIDFSQTEELVKFGSEKSKLMILVSIFIAFSFFLMIHAFVSIYNHWTDQSIPLTICPRSHDLDSPVIMKPITQSDNLFQQDRWIRGFVRKIILNSYPRTAEDAEKFFPYMVSISEGFVKRKYELYVNDIEAIKNYLRSGNIVRFYPKNSADLRIRKSDGKNDQWVVEIDGYMVKDIAGNQERTTPTLRYTIESRPATRTNPAGLVIVDTEIDKIADYVSGRKEKEQEEKK